MHCHMKVFERIERKLQEYLLSLCFIYLYDKVALLILKYLFANLKYCLSSTMKMLEVWFPWGHYALLLVLFSICVYVFVCISLFIVHLWNSWKAKGGSECFGAIDRQFWATMWVLETKPGSSTKTEYTFNPLAISPVLACNSYVWVND